jgi:hypothetical protein
VRRRRWHRRRSPAGLGRDSFFTSARHRNVQAHHSRARTGAGRPAQLAVRLTVDRFARRHPDGAKWNDGDSGAAVRRQSPKHTELHAAGDSRGDGAGELRRSPDEYLYGFSFRPRSEWTPSRSRPMMRHKCPQHPRRSSLTPYRWGPPPRRSSRTGPTALH